MAFEGDGVRNPLGEGVDGPVCVGEVSGGTGGYDGEGLYVDRDYTGDGLDEGGDLVAGDALAEAACGEAVQLAEGLDDGGLDDGRVVVGVVGDIGGEAEEGFEEGNGRDGDEGIAVFVERGDEISQGWIAWRQGHASASGDGEEGTAAGAAGNPDGVGFGDAGEGGGVVLVVGDGDGTAEGENGQGGVAADIGDRLRILAAGGRFGIDDAADSERAVDERGDAAGADVGGYSGTDTVGGLDVVLACGQGGAFAGVADAVAEEDFGGAVGLI